MRAGLSQNKPHHVSIYRQCCGSGAANFGKSDPDPHNVGTSDPGSVSASEERNAGSGSVSKSQDGSGYASKEMGKAVDLTMEAWRLKMEP
jgi:hypothetical protein